MELYCNYVYTFSSWPLPFVVLTYKLRTTVWNQYLKRMMAETWYSDLGYLSLNVTVFYLKFFGNLWEWEHSFFLTVTDWKPYHWRWLVWNCAWKYPCETQVVIAPTCEGHCHLHCESWQLHCGCECLAACLWFSSKSDLWFFQSEMGS